MTTDNTVVDQEKVDAVVADEQLEAHDDVVAADADAAEIEYQKLWDERVAKREAEKNGTIEAAVAPPVEVAVEDVKTDDAPAKADEAVDTKKEAEKPAPAAPAAVDYAAIVASLPEAQREAASAAFAKAQEQIAKLQHDNRSVVGRMSAYQKKYEELAGKGHKPAEAAKAATTEQTEKWKQFAEDYPDVASALEARLEEARPGAKVEAMAQFVENEMKSRFFTEAGEAVAIVHPNWRETAKTKEFTEWTETSPTYGRLASSDDVADAVALFDMYEFHRSKTAAAAPVVNPKIAADAEKLAARRGAQVEGGKAADTNSASPNQSVDLSDDDQLFAFYANKANSRMSKRNG